MHWKIKNNVCTHTYIPSISEKLEVYKENKKPEIDHPKQFAISPPLSSILTSAECNYTYPPVDILRDMYDTTTKGRQYFANIKKNKISVTQFQLNLNHRRGEGISRITVV